MWLQKKIPLLIKTTPLRATHVFLLMSMDRHAHDYQYTTPHPIYKLIVDFNGMSAI
jgi:hypothetical protein